MPDFLDEMTSCIPALRRYANALTHDRDTADDLVQDRLERAIRKKALWKPQGPLRPWLYRVLVNVYRNNLRGRNRRPSQVPIDDVAEQLFVPAAQTGRIALAEMARAIEKLSGEHREALLLVVVEGLSYAEAADVLEIPLGTLMSRLGAGPNGSRPNDPGRPAKSQGDKMTGSEPQITEADLISYVDGQLEDRQRDAVRAHLASNPADARKVAMWQQQNATLTALYGPLDTDALPERLDVYRIERRLRSQRADWRNMAAASILILTVGLTGGWFGRGLVSQVAEPTLHRGGCNAGA